MSTPSPTTAKSTGRLWPLLGRFDAVLLVIAIIVGLASGAAVWRSGYYVMILSPAVAVILGLVFAALARRHRYLVAFTFTTATTIPWIVVGARRGVLADNSEWFALLQLIGLTWVLPSAVLFYVLWMTRE